MLDAAPVIEQEVLDIMEAMDDPAFAFQPKVFVEALGPEGNCVKDEERGMNISRASALLS